VSSKIHISCRLEPEEIARLDALAAALSTPWCAVTRSGALRATMEKGLPIAEVEAQARADASVKVTSAAKDTKVVAGPRRTR